MPELPEVETVRRGLEKLIIHKTITKVTHDTAKSFPNTPHDVKEFLIGSKVTAIRRRAKVLLIDLSSQYTLVIHLKMTGQIVCVAADMRFGAGHPNESLIAALPDKSTRVTLTFEDDSHLYFNDQRKFGWMRLIPTLEVPMIDFMKTVGPEPLESDFTWEILKQRLKKRSRTSIKAALLDQKVLAGIGNIYADEALWGAYIHPSTLVGALQDKEYKTLHHEIRFVLNLSIEKGGSTDKNYVNAEGKKGSYISFARVFRRENLPCPRCTTRIIKTRVAGRGTHICPVCQKETV